MNFQNLQENHLRSARLFSDRAHLIRSLVHATNGRVAEIGVMSDELSKLIVSILNPAKFVAFHSFAMYENPTFSEASPQEVLQEMKRLDFHHDRFSDHSIALGEEPGPSNEHLSSYPDDYFDFIYIDGRHTYEKITQDATLALHKLKQEGIIVFSDYVMTDHIKNQPFGAVRAVNELVEKYNLHVAGFALQSEDFYDIAIRRKPSSEGVIQPDGTTLESDEQYNSDYDLIRPYFDRQRYIVNYGRDEDIDESDPLAHYIKIGARKGYAPSRFFDSGLYLENYPDVADAGMNPLVHYLRFGFDEGRTPRADSTVSMSVSTLDLDDVALNYRKWRLPCIIDGEMLRTSEDIQRVTLLINKTEATATILDRKSADWLIVFSGGNEHFYYLNKMRSFWGNVLFLRDTTTTYYAKNPNLPAPDLIASYVDFLTGPRLGKTIMLGQSAGGHAALYQSSLIKDCLTLSFSPQAYHRDLYSHNIYFEDGIRKKNPASCAPNLVAHLRESPDAPRYVVVGKSESSHDDSYYWGDAVSAGLLASTGKCSVMVVNRNEHPTLQYLDSRKLFTLLHENYELFLNNPRKASELFCRSKLYYDNVQEKKRA